MKYRNTEDTAINWQVSERSVRNYCSNGRVPGAKLEGKTWLIPEDAQKPKRQKRHSLKGFTLLRQLQEEKTLGKKGGLYHKFQVLLTYNSNHIEGTKLSEAQTNQIFATNTIFSDGEIISIDDVIETANHFRCVDFVIDNAQAKLTESFIKQLHYTLKSGTSASDKTWFKVGGYKMLENEVGGRETTSPANVASEMKTLLSEYNSLKKITLNEIIDFHIKFESIHPFQDGNGRIGRLIIFKECLKNNITPIIIFDDLKMYYYRGLQNYPQVKEYLIDTALTCQDRVKELLSNLL